MFGAHPETFAQKTGAVHIEQLADLLIAAHVDPFFTSAKRHTHTHTVNGVVGTRVK